jgi:hypothetical protein
LREWSVHADLGADENTSVIASRLAISPGFGRWKRWQLAGALKTEVSMAKIIRAADVTEAEASVAESQASGESAHAVKCHQVKRARRRVSGKVSRPKKSTKQNLVLQMLRRQSGVSINDIVDKTGWQPHSVRGFLSGVVRRKLNLPLVPEVGKDGVRRYHVASLKPAKA